MSLKDVMYNTWLLLIYRYCMDQTRGINSFFFFSKLEWLFCLIRQEQRALRLPYSPGIVLVAQVGVVDVIPIPTKGKRIN